MLLVPIGREECQLTFQHSEPHFCRTCGESRDFGLRLIYAWGSLFYVAGFVIERQYQLVCPHCGHGWVMDTRDAERMLGGDPVPFYQRSGWIVAAVLSAIVGVAALRHNGLL